MKWVKNTAAILIIVESHPFFPDDPVYLQRKSAIENNIKHISELYTNKFEYDFDLFKTDDDNNRLSNSNSVYFKALYETLKNFNINEVIIDIMNKKINDQDKIIKDNYETLNNKIIDISNKCETQNNSIFNKIILFIYCVLFIYTI